jgi:LPXTG-motif cell wall-anchored protein
VSNTTLRLIRKLSGVGLVLALAAVTGMASPAPGVASAQAAQGDIVDTAVAAGSFKTLATAVQAAGLVDTLKGPGPFTVFAPTDEAFAKLPPGTVDSLLKDHAKLRSVLTYHVVAGKVTASDVAKLQSAKTVQGADLAINTAAGVKVNNATVTQADVMASNGVIHVIDTVLLPPDMVAAAAAPAAQVPGALPRAGEAGPDLPILLGLVAASMLAGGLLFRHRLNGAR